MSGFTDQFLIIDLTLTRLPLDSLVLTVPCMELTSFLCRDLIGRTALEKVRFSFSAKLVFYSWVHFNQKQPIYDTNVVVVNNEPN